MGQENDQIAPRTLNLSFITCYLLSPKKKQTKKKKKKKKKNDKYYNSVQL